jgi:hypothetical protein
MAHYTYDDNTFDMRTASLMERLHNYFDDASMGDEREDGQLEPLFKFHSLILIADIYEHVRLFLVNRDRRLSEYFSERTIKQCLRNVVDIEELQKRLPELHEDIETIESSMSWASDLLPMAGVEVMPGTDEIKLLHLHGIEALSKDANGNERPSVSKSILWRAPSYSHEGKDYVFGKVFRKAKEELDDDNCDNLSPDPEDKIYNNIRAQSRLSNRVAWKVESHEWLNNPKKSKENKRFDFLGYIISIQRKAEEATADDIYFELKQALEYLRNVFMTDAEDIYYVRTGDFSKLEKVYSKDVITHFYTELPFKKYYEAKKEYVELLSDQMEVELGEWRISRGYIGRKLTPQEQIEFLQERKDGVIENMKSYEELWKLRMHSGGLDADVTPENFARMFYRRKGVDRYFIELQWELEELTSLIAKNKQKPAKDSQELVQTPEQKAVADFVDSIIMLVNTAYEKWNNQRVVPAVHKAEVHIVIKKEELIKFMQDKMKNDFEELCEFCYPEASKQDFCQFVVQLQNDGYFGALPNKLLAEVLAPIAKISVGTARNYLSQS